jgi:hypothetical protein
MIYYMLRCETCGENFRPLLSDTQGELMIPADEDDAEQTQTAGAGNIAALRRWQEKHRGHEWAEVAEEIDTRGNVLVSPRN